MHARVPSSRTVHKQHGHGPTHAHAHGHGPAQGHGHAPKVNRRPTSRPDSPAEGDEPAQRPQHRRATSEVKLSRHSSAANLPKSLSHTSLKRNRSHVEVGKRNKSSEKLKRTSSGTKLHRPKTSKTQVHFDLGDDPDDEWVDASGSNSPYLSRKGSLNSSAQSSFRAGPSVDNSQPATPSAPSQLQNQTIQDEDEDGGSGRSSPNRETVQRKEYLTSRILQRTPSHGAPPKMTVDIAKAAPPQMSHSATSTDRNVSPRMGSNQDELVSRFVDAPGPGLASSGSFYHPPNGTGRRLEDLQRRPNSTSNFTQLHGSSESVTPVEVDNSALVPKPARRTAAPAAETSRTQQKLNLQRASSVLEPGQAMAGGGGVVGASPLIGVGGPGFDGGNSRDPRIGKLLERTGMEYLVVRRYQNPVARSLNRLSRLPMDKTRKIPRTNSALPNGKRPTDAAVRHNRNVSMPDPRQNSTPKREASIRTNGAGSSYDGDDTSRLNERFSGISVGTTDEEDGTQVLLRNLWEKSMDLSASTD